MTAEHDAALNIESIEAYGTDNALTQEKKDWTEGWSLEKIIFMAEF